MNTQDVSKTETTESCKDSGGQVEPLVMCISCDAEFELSPENDRDEGYFCNKCLQNPFDVIKKETRRQ